MKGHEPLIEMRNRGSIPSIVYVETGARPGFLPVDWRAVCPQFAHVWIADDEPVRRLDLRFLVALFVQVSGSDAARVEAIAEAAKAAGASRVLSVVVSPPGPFQALLSAHDTAGIMTWSSADAVAS